MKIKKRLLRGTHFKMLMWFIIMLLASACIVIPLVSYGSDARIRDVLVTSSADQILAYARVTNCFTKEMESAIMTGVPTTFTFVMDLYYQRTGWFDKQLARVRIKHYLKYDEVKKVFHFSSSGLKKEADFTDLASAKLAMAELDGAPLFRVSSLSQGVTYYLDLKAKLDEIRLPLHMEILLFFVSLWDFETDWYHQPFVVQGRSVIMKSGIPES